LEFGDWDCAGAAAVNCMRGRLLPYIPPPKTQRPIPNTRIPQFLAPSMTYTRYIALGDSMSIDLYPALDAGEIDVAVALERDPAAGRVAAPGGGARFPTQPETPGAPA
jgi:hypothetical protein